MRKFTREQKTWLKEHAEMQRFKTRTGRTRNSKLRRAYESKFGDTRSVGSIGWIVRQLLKGPFPSQLKREGPRKHSYYRKYKGGLTLTELEDRVGCLLTSIREIRKFAKKG